MPRVYWFIDRYGSTIESGVSLERFAELYDSIDGVPSDEDWREIAIVDSDAWSISSSRDYIVFGNDESSAEEGEVRPATRELVLTVAEAFMRGDFAAVRAHLSA